MEEICKFSVIERLGYIDYILNFDNNVLELINQNCEPIETDCKENKPYLAIYSFKILKKEKTYLQHITDYGDRQLKINYCFSPEINKFVLEKIKN